MREVRFYAALLMVSAWFVIALLAAPAMAQPDRYIHAQPQAAVMALCEEALGEPAFHCATWEFDAGGYPYCVMHVPTMLRERNLERYNEVIAELREECASPPPVVIGGAP